MPLTKKKVIPLAEGTKIRFDLGGRPIVPLTSNLTISSDASKIGWGVAWGVLVRSQVVCEGSDQQSRLFEDRQHDCCSLFEQQERQFGGLCISIIQPNPSRPTQGNEGEILLLIAPLWFAQPWLPLLIDPLVDFPIGLGNDPSLFNECVSTRGAIHPLFPSLKLGAWQKSGNISKQQIFQQQLSTCSATVLRPQSPRHELLMEPME